MSEEKYYEMLWNCESCGTKGLFAQSQKHCPLCGAAQNPEKRYFPEEGQEVEVQGHQYVGADWHCPYCQSPNGAAAQFCGACGGHRDGSKEVKEVLDPAANVKEPEPQAPAGPPASSGGGGWIKIIVVLLVIVLGVLMARFLWKSDETFKVTALNWSREIDIEQYTAVEEAKWCKELPSGAHSIRRTQEEKGKKKVPDGETCKEVKIDKRDGTFTKKRECTPKYKEIPEMADKCHYRINTWKVVRTDKAQGSKGTEPKWPAPRVSVVSSFFANTIGNERLGNRREGFSAQLQSSKGESLSCSIKPEVWSDLKVGDVLTVKVRGTGGAVCDEIKKH